jgi:hypothetical protein
MERAERFVRRNSPFKKRDGGHRSSLRKVMALAYAQKKNPFDRDTRENLA